MPPIEVGPARGVMPVDARLARPAGGEKMNGARGSADAPDPVSVAASGPAAPSVETSAALEAGTAPVDIDRVTTIRRAVEAGKYPVIPVKIADAMIAAGVLLRSPK